MALFIATPLRPAERSAILAGEAWHFSKARPEQVAVDKLTGGGLDEPNARIHLKAPSGWQLDFWKFIRDVTVWDPLTLDAADRGRYLYFFLGRPGTWTRRMNVQEAALTIRIRGGDLLRTVPAVRLFYRSADKVIVVRGDYQGLAILDPPP